MSYCDHDLRHACSPEERRLVREALADARARRDRVGIRTCLARLRPCDGFTRWLAGRPWPEK